MADNECLPLFDAGQPVNVSFVARRFISMLRVFIVFCVSKQPCLHKTFAAWYWLESAAAVKQLLI